jgi:hypothetical protein
MILEATITCPHCLTATLEKMPTDGCQFFFFCAGCGEMLHPQQWDCCVFCAYSDQVCPPKQPY